MSLRRIAFVVVSAFGLAACGSAQLTSNVGGRLLYAAAPPPANVVAQTSENYECDTKTCPIDIFFGTTRSIVERPGNSYSADGLAYTVSGRAPVIFTSDRANLQLGRVRVTPPSGDRTAALRRCEQQEKPAPATSVDEFRVATGLYLYNRDAFAAEARRLGGLFSGKDAIVFVHGYNVTFEDAAKRLAQLVSDTGFCGVPFLFSWPSDGQLLSYEFERESAEYSVRSLKDYIQLIRSETGASGVHLVAHSMGNIVLLRAIMELQEQQGFASPLQAPIKEVILAAPDVDRDLFTQFLSRIGRIGRGTTLYASSTDRPLKFSKFLAKRPRAGIIINNDPLIVEGVTALTPIDRPSSRISGKSLARTSAEYRICEAAFSN